MTEEARATPGRPRTMTAVVQDGIVVQVDRTEKIRIEKRGPA